MGCSTDNTGRAEGQPDRDELYIGSNYDHVSGDYFTAMGIPLVKGRAFSGLDFRHRVFTLRKGARVTAEQARTI
jgi:hypothetical protein